MASVDLVFFRAPLTSSPVDLVFGEAETVPPDYEITLAASLPGLVASVFVVPYADASLDATLPGLTLDASIVGITAVALDGTLPAPTLDASVVSGPPVELDATLPALTADVAGIASPTVELDATLPALTAGVFVDPYADATLDATLPPLTADGHIGVLVDVTLDATLPGLTLDAHAVPSWSADLSADLPGLTADIAAEYLSNTARPLVGQVGAVWQVADHGEVGTQAGMQDGTRLDTGADTPWQVATQAPAGVIAPFQDGVARTRVTDAPFQQADRLIERTASSKFQNGARTPLRRYEHWQEAARLRANQARARHQDGLHDRRKTAAARWQKSVGQSTLQHDGYGPAAKLDDAWYERHQEAMRPHPGTSSSDVTPPTPHACYTPPAGGAVNLLFKYPWPAGMALLFVCDGENPGGDPDPDPVPGETVVVPIKRVYVVINSSTLHRVEGNVLLPTFGMQMSLDVDSWTWSFSASLPGRALGDIEPSSPGAPVLVEATINGVAYRMQIEKRSRDRSFDADGLKISGRGLASVLDAPYSAARNFINDDERTAQQLMNDVLTDGGVSIGWEVDYQAVDWSVPAGAWSHQGTYIDALNAIAAAAGSYLQPHRVNQTVKVLPRYPVLPWDWADTDPDYEIPSSVATTESIEWADKPVYNRVFVSGVRQGVLGQVTRAGTDGGLVAPMVTDPLITTAAAARQRGEPILADVGAQARVVLRMPILAETGIIVPGKLVRYVDGDTTRVGLTRAVGVDIGRPEAWQTITLETHV